MHLGFRESCRIQNQPQVVKSDCTQKSCHGKALIAIDRPWPVDCWFIGRRASAGGAQSAAMLVLHDAGFLPIPFAGLGVFPLVVFFLALHQADLDLDPALFPVERQRHYGIALAGGQALELVEFTAAQQQFALYEGLPAEHPLRGFRAGNRDSLRVEDPAFQQGLNDFHQQFYQTGQMTLSLAGPQSLEELKALAEHFASMLPVGDKVAQVMPLPLAVKSYQQVGERSSNLLCAFDALPDSSAEALAFLCHWLNSATPR